MIRKICLLMIIVFIFYSLVYVNAEEIEYYTCGMHPSVRVQPEDYTEDALCPICNMKLVPVYKDTGDTVQSKDVSAYYACYCTGKEGCSVHGETYTGTFCEEHVFTIDEIGKNMKCPICGGDLKKLESSEAEQLRGMVSRVKIPINQISLAGVEAQPVKKHHLFKNIRTVGKVAYDPELAVAQEEFISALGARDRIKEGQIDEISRRYDDLINSSKRKLRLLGMSNGQIDELEKTKLVETSFLLPEDKMWIYGDVYEYELGWVKPEQEVVVTTISFPGEEFKGKVESINPLIDPKTRSARIRVEVNNTGLKLQPEMYVDIIIKSMYVGPDNEHMVLAIPVNAVLDTGLRKIVWIDKGNGEYEGREIITGPESITDIDGQDKRYYPVLKGLKEGDRVVIKSNFLIDSQSQISGTAAAAYGGALNVDKKKTTPPLHQH